MSIIGKVDSLWRYPVKSMRGEQLLQYRPRFRHADKAARPSNLSEAESIAPGLTPVSADPHDLMVDIEVPTGEKLSIDDPALLRRLRDTVPGTPDLTLVRSDRSMTDCRPVSLLSVQTVRQLGEELGTLVDQRRFRANIYLDLNPAGGFDEDGFVGRSVRIGSKLVISILERDPRCAMITFDPDTGESKPEVLKRVAQAHKGMAGVYGAVLVEGTVRAGDPVELLD